MRLYKLTLALVLCFGTLACAPKKQNIEVKSPVAGAWIDKEYKGDPGFNAEFVLTDDTLIKEPDTNYPNLPFAFRYELKDNDSLYVFFPNYTYKAHYNLNEDTLTLKGNWYLMDQEGWNPVTILIELKGEDKILKNMKYNYNNVIKKDTSIVRQFIRFKN